LKPVTKGFGGALLSLWLRLVTISLIALLFAATIRDTPSRIGGWRYYLTIWEVVFELAVRVTVIALASAAMATVIAVAVAPFLHRAECPERLAEKITRVSVVVAAFSVFAIVLRVLLQLEHLWMSPAVVICYCLVFGGALWIPGTRGWLTTSLDQFLGETAVCRTATAIALVTVMVVTGEWAMRVTTTGVVTAASAAERSRPNILLITFDALSAEDMSLYGYRLPTTPRMEEFARKSSVFNNFFSGSTFTTASIATILTGRYPTEHHVYHWQGHLSRSDAAKTLPHLLRASDYSTAASISNPLAYFLAAQLGNEFGILPTPPHSNAAFMTVWDALEVLHQPQPFGSRAGEFDDLGSAWAEATSLMGRSQAKSNFPPFQTFTQARQVLARMPAPFFLWVHVFAPHDPYLSSPPYLGRFLPSHEMRTAEEQVNFPWVTHYAPKYQHQVDKARLRYDEFVAESDGALGAFLDELQDAGKLRDTAVVISADHGESFEGGVYTHGNEDQVPPEIHIPLIIRMPGQKHGSRVAVTADQTSLAPTLLDIAGLPQPDYMRNQSLLPWLNRNNEGQGEGMAFTQHLAGNSVFAPLKNGTVGVIEGRYQYVLNLATDKTVLRDLTDPLPWDRDRSVDDPILAKRLLDAIYSRFPDLRRRAK
jgi:arylsulfatase A-like enzyme